MLQKRRQLTGVYAYVVRSLAALVPVSTVIYVSRLLPDFGVIIYKEQFLAFFLTLCLAITFLIVPAYSREKARTDVPFYDLTLTVAALCIGGYIAFEYGSLITTMGLITTDKVIVSVIGIVLLLEATRRQAGWTMVCLALVALGYAYFGHYLSGVFETRVISLDRLVIYNYLGTGAILGTPLYVAATIVAAFVLFGQMLFLVGGGDAISNFAFALMGRRRGGPAKVAILSSALFGSLSGSASANVATTGMLTIPMMRRVGYSDNQAAAIEAVASTGGLVLPPVMAATGFLMAEFLGIPYSTVAIAAAMPALLFYLCLYLQVDMEASRNGIEGWTGDDLPPLKRSLLDFLPVVLPFAALLYALFGLFWNPAASAFVGTAITLAVSLAIGWMRQTARGYVNVIATAGEAVVFIAIMCAIAGLVVGCLGLTGLGASLAQNLVQISGGSVWLLLGMAAIGCIVLGMGVPVTATYIILVILVGPALVQVGINELSAHMFVFYFGTLSFLTPPVCLAVFVAASIAQSSPMRTAGYALRFAVIAYLIPFVFAFNSAFLFEGSWFQVANAAVAGIAGVILLSAGLVGYFKGFLPWPVRIVLAGVGLASLFLCDQSYLVTFASVCTVFLAGWISSHKTRGASMRAVADNTDALAIAKGNAMDDLMMDTRSQH